MDPALDTQELTKYDRRLPHWRMEGAIYFVTWRLNAGQSGLSELERDMIMTAITFHHNTKYRLDAFVVMDDHVHLLIQPFESWELSRLVKEMKAYTSRMMKKEFGRETPVWQDEFYDRIVRNEVEFKEKGEYILTNPLRRWPELVEYPWVGVPD